MSTESSGASSGAASMPPPGSSTTSAPGKPPKITQHAFEVTIGLMLALALLAASGRTYARVSKFQKLLVDDVFFYVAVVFLIAGTGILYKDIPLIYLQENVQAGLEMPPTDFVSRLIQSLKLQDSLTVLLAGAIFSIKFSFLFFFRHLIWQSKPLMVWWWTILVICIPATAVFMFSDFISCNYFDERILIKCVTPTAMARQNATFKASAALDIITDAFLISVPVLLLWNVRVSIRRKLALGGILCLSIFMIIIAIVRIAAGHGAQGQVSASRAIFWVQVEACVAVMVVSATSFRTLFVAHQANKNQRMQEKGQMHTSDTSGGIGSKARLLWPSKWSRSKTTNKDSFDVSRRDIDDGPAAPTNGVKTHIRRSSSGDSFDDPKDVDLEAPLQVHVRKEVSSTENSDPSHMEEGRARPSVEVFV